MSKLIILFLKILMKQCVRLKKNTQQKHFINKIHNKITLLLYFFFFWTPSYTMYFFFFVNGIMGKNKLTKSHICPTKQRGKANSEREENNGNVVMEE